MLGQRSHWNNCGQTLALDGQSILDDSSNREPEGQSRWLYWVVLSPDQKAAKEACLPLRCLGQPTGWMNGPFWSRGWRSLLAGKEAPFSCLPWQELSESEEQSGFSLRDQSLCCKPTGRRNDTILTFYFLTLHFFLRGLTAWRHRCWGLLQAGWHKQTKKHH